jgi:hypothetical protein
MEKEFPQLPENIEQFERHSRELLYPTGRLQFSVLLNLLREIDRKILKRFLPSEPC